MAAKSKAPRGVGTIIREALLADKTNEEVLQSVNDELPDAKTTTATVAWYRNQMRKAGEPVKTARDIKKARKDEEKDPLA